MKLISILHLSDLHRSKGSEICNKALLSSLLNDRDNYTQSPHPGIKAPDIIIVSGDIIRGSTNPTGSDEEIKEQYDEAFELLNDLVRMFLNGDKQRLVLIPGNHDIDFKYSKQSMVKVDHQLIVDANSLVKTEYLRNLKLQHSKIRWSLKEMSFYEIKDETVYNKRLEAYTRFYHDFYEGKRLYSLDPKNQYEIIDLPAFNLTIAAFSSCYNNDHLRFTGDIHPECIAKANLELRNFKKAGRLIVATWHHNTKGFPDESNYMDSGKLKNFIDSGIVLGFHGHQHKTEMIREFSNVIDEKKIIVFSAGTLCGGPGELPPGNNRQYNIIVLGPASEDSQIKVTLHAREKTESSSFDNPIWAAGRIDSTLFSSHSVFIPAPPAPAIEAILIEIEKLIWRKDFASAKEGLLQLDTADAFVRKYLIQYITESEDYQLAIDVFPTPQNNEEAVAYLYALLLVRDKDRIRTALSNRGTFNTADASIKELIKKLEVLNK